MSRRILHIISSLEQHGTTKQLRLVAEGLAARGDDVHVCVLSGGTPGTYAWCAALAENHVDTSVLTHRSTCDASCLVPLYRTIRRHQPDVVHTWLAAGNLFGRIAARAAGAAHTVASIRDMDPFAHAWRWPAERWLAKRTDAIVVNSSAVREHAIRHGIDSRKLHTITNAACSASRSSYTRDELLDDLNLPPDTRLLGTVGPLVRTKNLKQLIWVGDIFKSIHEPVHFLVMGDGPQRWRLERFARQIEIDDRVHFLGHRDDVLDILPHLDVYLSASQHEGCPNGLLEAMAAGVPAVVTNISGHRDLVHHGESGFLVPVDSRADVARHSKKLLEDAQLAFRVGEAGRNWILKNHRPADMIERYRALYARIVG